LPHLFISIRAMMGWILTEIRHLLDQHGHPIGPVITPPDLPSASRHMPLGWDGNLENKVKEAC
jgi:hypothetical protein